MDGAVMVASQTTSTSVVVLPFRGRPNDIVDRAHLLAFPALDTYIRIDGEFPVGYHPLVEIAAYDIGVKSGSGPLF